MAEVKTITKENFQTEVVESKTPVLIDFWATWCGPCRMMSPVVDQLAGELDGKIKVGKLNVDEQQELAVMYNVMSIPTLLLFRDDKLLLRSVGYKPKQAIMSEIDSALS